MELWERMSYVKVFEPPRMLGRLMADDRFHYQTVPPTGLAPGSHILHISCQTLTVSHIPYLAQQIMQRLGLDFVTLGGPENCCGSFHWHVGDDDLEKKIATMTLAGFRRLKPVRVVSTCPDCDESFDHHTARQHTFQRTNIAELFAEHLDKLKPHMKPVNKRIVIHWHDDRPQRQRDTEAIRALMKAIPGLEVLDAPCAHGPGPHCVKQFRNVTPERTEAMFNEAKRLGADYIVVPYHGCYRQHCKHQLLYGLEIQHYLGLLAQSLGIDYTEPFKTLRLLDDVEKALDTLRPKMREFGFEENEVREYLKASIYV